MHTARSGSFGASLKVALVLAMLLVVGSVAEGVQLQDLSRIKGEESSRLIGMGLVMGLNGTGDGGRSATTMRRLAAMMNRLGDPLVEPGELRNADNVAVVYLSATVPAHGVREGDQVNVHLSAPMADSLEGGRLVLTPMLGPLPGSPIYAFAEGAVTIPDPDHPNSATVQRGATLTQDIYSQFADEQGRMTMVLNDANATWPMATTISTLINDLVAPDGPPVAMALDAKNVVVQIPERELANPGPFIAQILEVDLDPTLVRTEARVVINQSTGTIVMTEDVEISPVVISHNGMTITAMNGGGGAPQVPGEPQNFVALDPEQRGGARLADLVDAFNQLNVPAEDRIAIIREIHRSGKLHAQLVEEN